MKTKLNIGPYEWDYDDESNSVDTKDLGECTYAELTIKVSETIKHKKVKKCTIIHEILHAMFFSSGYIPKDEERIVDILANQMIAFIDLNKDFVKNQILDE